MLKSHDFTPDWTSAPGETIRDILELRGFSIAAFAQLMEQPVDRLLDLLEGRTPITIAIARKLSSVLGASVEFWMARDFEFREDRSRLASDRTNWLTELPKADMVKFGWIQEPRSELDLETYLDFFGVRTLSEWNHKYSRIEQLAAFRTSKTLESRPVAVAAWLRQGEIESDAIVTSAWDRERFALSLPAIRQLTIQKDPSVFIPRLQTVCAENGVAVVLVRFPTGCRASGAARFVGDKPVIQLSFRYLANDQFWFTFFHEAAHLLLHSQNDLFIDGVGGARTVEEAEADLFAAMALVPEQFRSQMLEMPITPRDILRFARKVRVAPGIIVGQLQHAKRIGPNQFNHLKRRFQWEQ
jgi:plasmid maintenance system antidote protein VapI/Zn-dependent peptidase ImmA (M78 family)